MSEDQGVPQEFYDLFAPLDTEVKERLEKAGAREEASRVFAALGSGVDETAEGKAARPALESAI
jgi:hypothetical protein